MRLSDMTCRHALLPAIVLTLACGGEQSVASKSAAAYRQAQSKGLPVGGGHEHGGHAATATATSTTAETGIDHSAHGATASAAHATMDHGATPSETHAGHGAAATSHAQHGRSAMAASGHDQHAMPSVASTTDHSTMQHGTTDHRTMQHGTTPASPDSHAQHRPSSATAHAQHGVTSASGRTASPIAPITAPQSNAEIRGVQPSATLQRDAFDAAAPRSVSEASKALAGGDHDGHETRGITPGQDHENPPSPMPATRDGRPTGGTHR